MDLWLLFILHSFVTYRVARLIVLDEIIDATRKKILHRLEGEYPGPYSIRRQPREFFKDKAWSLLQCPFCVTPYVAGGVVLIHLWWLDGLPYPVWWWLGIGVGALLTWTYIEDD